MTQIICLANSQKNGNRCIAGIDIETGKWVRPIYTNSINPKDGRVPSNIRLINGQEPKLLDIIDIPLDNKGEDFGFESENLNILPGQWKKLGQVSPNDVKQYCDNSYYILHNRIKYVEVTLLQRLPFYQRKTLQLVYTSSLSVVKDNNHWKGSLVNNSNQKLDNIKITDLELIGKLKSGYQPKNPCLVTISLSMPWSPPNWEGDKPCWKLIAGVIEFF